MATRKNKGGKKQKIYRMKGCSKRHSLGGKRHKYSSRCKHLLKGGCGSCSSQTGGSCASCNSQTGGNFYKTNLNPVPYPLVGEPWLPQIKGWPGVDGIRNYFANNLYKTDVQTMMKLDGGAKKSWGGKNKSRKNTLQGGGLLPQEFINLGRDLKFNIQSTMNSLNGYSAPVNPKPYMDQFAKANKMII
jgi:hypothetical protein